MARLLCACLGSAVSNSASGTSLVNTTLSSSSTLNISFRSNDFSVSIDGVSNLNCLAGGGNFGSVGGVGGVGGLVILGRLFVPAFGLSVCHFNDVFCLP